ncbi:pentapeptide repeat-containing protein [Sodalis ligni]|uniref:pentapeptide repeat-containing protein n=1 Tax=Sodalis ligni TaxID=2697027 RepID=UPI00193EC519|nr:pentapeptide repeat-containing protein [Sodalis ligni]QWA13567.1 pentapeptide repeat-containing protein [Sodalis ligni]
MDSDIVTHINNVPLEEVSVHRSNGCFQFVTRFRKIRQSDNNVADNTSSPVSYIGIGRFFTLFQRARPKEYHPKGPNLRSVYLCKADIRGENLRNANLKRANLYKANLCNAILHKADLRHADLRKANLYKVDLRKADLSYANLGKANLQGVKFRKANLTGANLTDATVAIGLNNWRELLTIKPSPRQLGKANLRLTLPESWDASLMEWHLNHINNSHGGSLLTLIDSLAHHEQKVKLLLQLMDSLVATDMSIVALPLLSIIGKSAYSGEQRLCVWLSRICADFMWEYGDNIIPPLREPVMNALFEHFRRDQTFALQFNSVFIQLISQGIAGEGCLRKEAINIYQSYLNHEKVIPYSSQHTFGDFSGKPDWSDRHAANLILFSGRRNGRVMLLSQNTLAGMLTPDRANPVWNQMFVYQGLENLSAGEYQLPALFAEDFRLFLGPLMEAERTTGFNKFLNAIPLGDLRTSFESATKHKLCREKLVSLDKQLKLAEIFAPLLEENPQRERFILHEKHYQDVIAAFGISDADRTRQAHTLLCLAAVVANYTSSAIFGTECESPLMLRSYAWAMMEKAYQRDAAIFDSQEQYTDWENHLLGLAGESSSCTASLSEQMITHAKKRFPVILASVMPPAWY